jgi:dihydrofolate reductase
VHLSLIAAVAANGVIGNRGALPWRLPDDMARFRELTLGHAVIMGRSTFESLGRPLKRRRNVVLSRNDGLQIDGCIVVHSVESARKAVEGDDEAFVIGGAAVYSLFLPTADRLYITWIDAEVPGDTLFPPVDWREWKVIRQSAAPAGETGELPHRFVDYSRAAGIRSA